MGMNGEELEVRPLAPDDAPLLEPGFVWPEDEPWPGPGRFGTVRLGAWRGDRCAGRLRAEKVQGGLFIVSEVVVAAGEPQVAVGADLLGGLAGRAEGARLALDDIESEAPLRAWVEAGGWRLEAEKLVVEREPPWPSGPVPAGYALRSLAEVGEETFAAAMDRAAEGDAFEGEGPRDPLAELRDLIELAGERFDATGWFVLVEGDEPAGVLLPQRTGRREGTIFYLGVVPERRGRGLGRAIHALGLRLLGERGAARYAGSTDTRNEAMVRVFARNGCRELARQRYYEARSRSGSGRGRG
jgi:RimJ/RimL family protein N-acetyltransferase